MNKLLLVPVLAAAAVLAACAGTTPESASDEPPTTQTPPTDSDEQAGIGYDASPQAVVANVVSGGGFVPAEISVDQRPLFRLYGDGTVVMLPADDNPFESFPRLDEFKLNEDGIQYVLTAAEDAGLFGPAKDYGQPLVTDMPSTVVTIRTTSGDAELSVYGLDFADPASGLTEEQVAARNELSALIAGLRALPADRPDLLASDVTPYDAQAAALWLFEREVAPDQPVSEWPLSTLPEDVPADANGNRCLEVSGADLAALESAAKGKGLAGMLWESGEGVWSIGANLILPGDSGCATAA